MVPFSREQKSSFPPEEELVRKVIEFLQYHYAILKKEHTEFLELKLDVKLKPTKDVAEVDFSRGFYIYHGLEFDGLLRVSEKNFYTTVSLICMSRLSGIALKYREIFGDMPDITRVSMTDLKPIKRGEDQEYVMSIEMTTPEIKYKGKVFFYKIGYDFFFESKAAGKNSPNRLTFARLFLTKGF